LIADVMLVSKANLAMGSKRKPECKFSHGIDRIENPFDFILK